MRKAAVLLGFLVAGCLSGPGYRAPDVPLPQGFREARSRAPAGAGDTARPGAGAAGKGAVAPGEYWQTLGDTTLDRLIGEALRANYDVRAAEARVRAARAARLSASLFLAPAVTAQAGYTRQRLSAAAFPFGLSVFPDQNVWDGGFDAAWELDLWGRVRRSAQAQGALVTVARENLRDVQVSLVAELARSYFELRGAQEQLGVARRNAENQRRTLQVTRERLDAGRGTAFDTERAQAQWSSTEALIPGFESQVAAAQYQIGVLVGRAPATVADEVAQAAALPPLPAAVSLASPDSLIRRRPDVAAAERQLAAQRAFVSAAQAEYLPRITVGGAAGFSGPTVSSLGDRGTFRYAVGPVVSWPLLNLGQVKAGVDASRAREAEAGAQYTQTVLRALAEVETTLARYRTARARTARFEEAAAASERAAELARVRFTEGVADFLQVLDAERTQLEAQDQLAQARTAGATAYAALYKAVGGAWAPAGEGR